jgi:TPP-dependent pyruvate/acetoin dehydrogenase alpha subunit
MDTRRSDDEERFREAELEDAVGASDELYNVISRLKRLGLLTAEEDHQTKERIAEIIRTLSAKLPHDS